MSLAKRSLSVILIACLAFLMGCGQSAPSGAKPTAPVTVTVKYKGAPVEGASIMFLTPGGEANPGVGLTDASGMARLRTYLESDGAIIGSHKVVITKSETTGGAPSIDQDSAAYVSPDENAPPPPPVIVKHHVPQKYSSPATSDLTADVKSGKNEFTFDLQD